MTKHLEYLKVLTRQIEAEADRASGSGRACDLYPRLTYSDVPCEYVINIHVAR